jgi:hypothetical protein
VIAVKPIMITHLNRIIFSEKLPLPIVCITPSVACGKAGDAVHENR